jgi:hypothetical protein
MPCLPPPTPPPGSSMHRSCLVARDGRCPRFWWRSAPGDCTRAILSPLDRTPVWSPGARRISTRSVEKGRARAGRGYSSSSSSAMACARSARNARSQQCDSGTGGMAVLGRPGSRHRTGRRTPKAGAPPEPLVGHSPLREHARLVVAASAEEVDEVLPFEREFHGDVAQVGRGVHGGDATDRGGFRHGRDGSAWVRRRAQAPAGGVGAGRRARRRAVP